jgi:hypothetical protein
VNVGRAFLGVVAGYIVTVALVVVLDPLVAIAMLHGSRTANAAYLAANVVLSFVAALAGGALCARIARERQVLLGGVLGALILVVGMLAASRAHMAGVTPSYGYLIAILGALGALAGGTLVAANSRRVI